MASFGMRSLVPRVSFLWELRRYNNRKKTRCKLCSACAQYVPLQDLLKELRRLLHDDSIVLLLELTARTIRCDAISLLRRDQRSLVLQGLGHQRESRVLKKHAGPGQMFKCRVFSQAKILTLSGVLPSMLSEMTTPGGGSVTGCLCSLAMCPRLTWSSWP